ncbi:hypothetical protein GCM10007205_07950 [Oxalicibacterium flavum]|uniref:Uncharacterized protein n=1 Tax=Oxalicibacterium flavum TaxID=179467 RepID=A0A8J2ULE9_9BURK|nr:hypothetical protein [Oxalicibacterium flavum]GGC01072.1 hypothetical protein GCM10007205_07950 [Oxalicibacterium flavum]
MPGRNDNQAELISTIDEALLKISDGAKFDVPLVFTGELSEWTAHIEGTKYDSSIPAELARGLWEFQEQLYRAAAFALYGSDDIRKLTGEQRIDFQLIFNVNEGSTSITAVITGFLEKLAEGMTSMDSIDKRKTIITVALIIAIGWGAITITETLADVKKAEIAAQIAIDGNQQETARLQEFSKLAEKNQVAARFSKASEEGTRAIVKGASDAAEIKIGRITFDSEEIQEINQRAAKEKADAKIISNDFVIVRMEFRESATKIWLASAETGEFSITILDEEIDADSRKKIWECAEKRLPVKLEVNATIIRGQIRAAQLIKTVQS